MRRHLPQFLAFATAWFGSIDLIAQISFTANNSLLPGNYGSPGCVVDMNGDHLDDVVRLNGSQLTISYQQSDGTFQHQSFLNTNSSGLWSMCAGDLDNNGYNDLCLGDGSHVEFLYANNDGSAYASHYIPDYIFSQRSTMADIDNDGWLDSFVCHDVDQSHPYRNDGTGWVTEDQTLIETIDLAGNYAAIWVDYDNDHDIDLYITKCRQGSSPGDPERVNALYQNDGTGVYTEVAAGANMNSGDQSWSTVFEDFDNDGDFDAFIVEHTGQNKFMLNNGDGTFTDIIATTGINANDLGAWESQGADFDNDGWIDIFSEVGGGMYRNNGDLTFTNISIATDEGGIGDLNNDGWLDYQLSNTIYFNNGGTNHWIKVELDGIFSNNNGIGSRLWLYTNGMVQTREIRSGQGFSHMNSLQAHFGIGTATSIDSLVIDWPSGVHTVIDAPAIDQLHIVPEADCTLAPITITVNGSTQLCPGESTQLLAPMGYDSYVWSNGSASDNITVSDGGNYSVAAFDLNGCVALSEMVTVQVITMEMPEVEVMGEEVICDGETVELVSSPGSSYLWSNGATTQSILVDATGIYSVSVEGICSTNDSDPVTITVEAAAALPVTSDVNIPTPGTATLNAVGDNIEWYAGEFDTAPVGSGNSWETPFLNANTSFWCEANMMHGGALESGGKPDNSGGGGLPSSGAWSWFDAYEPFTILSVKVYAVGDGMRTINLCDENGNVMQTVDVMMLDGEQVVPLNFEVPVGTDLSLRCPQNNMFRNNSGVSYPYAIGTVGELTGSFYGGSYYYYFYDWQVQKEMLLCPSERVEVLVTVGPVGVAENDLGSVQVFPVPATSELQVAGLPAGAELELIDASGRLVMRQLGTGSLVIMDLQRVLPGAYMLRMIDRSGVEVRRITVTR
ncbi:MAG: VCBS repeat-containing protein [Flavobacteriales bacterium]|nr:VCBS repeat-containing protein [Flavobacteriales bacterium]